jgi:tRNA(His) 5'-end guanylyltransferase
MKDDLGDRMKGQYEDRTRYSLPRRTYTIMRLDGKAFHTYTRGLKKPFDKALSEDIDNAIIAMLPEIQGAVFAYTQSDEISILLTDFATPQTSAWFDGNLQKMASVAASVITAEFNLLRSNRIREELKSLTTTGEVRDFAHRFHNAYFDARVFTIPDRIEVMNYMIWRNQDCARNSVSMVAQSLYSHNELMGKSSAEQQEMIHDKGMNWANDFSNGEKNGRLVVKESYECPLSEINKGRTDEQKMIGLGADGLLHDTVKRTRWVVKGCEKFTEDKDKLLAMIPSYPA